MLRRAILVYKLNKLFVFILNCCLIYFSYLTENNMMKGGRGFQSLLSFSTFRPWKLLNKNNNNSINNYHYNFNTKIVFNNTFSTFQPTFISQPKFNTKTPNFSFSFSKNKIDYKRYSSVLISEDEVFDFPELRNINDYEEKELFYIIKDNNMDKFREEMAKIDIKNDKEKGANLLFIALFGRRANFLEYLLVDCQLNINVKYEGGSSLLNIAITTGDPQSAKLLLEKGISINNRLDNGETPLMEAIRLSRSDIVRMLLDKGADMEAKDKEGRTSLMIAIAEEKMELMKILIDKGAEIEAQDTMGRTPLFYAVENIEVVRLLLEKGANVNHTTVENTSPLLYSVYFNMGKGVIEILLSLGAGDKEGTKEVALICATMEGNIEAVKVLLKNGADANAKGDEGLSALMYAAESGLSESCCEISSLLLDHGASLNDVCDHGFSPLMYAVVKGNEDLVKLLIKRGADCFVKSKDGSSPLSCAQTHSPHLYPLLVECTSR